jgi:S1-C subfamily serine protease
LHAGRRIAVPSAGPDLDQKSLFMQISLLLLVLAGTPACSGSVAADAPDSTVVVVRGGSWAGSGVVWDVRARRVLTALHVVEEMPPAGIEVIVRGGIVLAARIIDREPLLDLALLEVSGPLGAGPPLRAMAAIAAGDVITLAGCPRAQCGRRDGRVIMSERPFAGSLYLAVAGEARPGMSGGAVLDARGAIVGIVDLTLAHEPGVTLAIPIRRAAERFPRG